MMRVAVLVNILILVVAADNGLWSGLDVPWILLSININRASKLEYYVACAVNQGPCDNRGNDLKPIMMDLATTQRCSKCETSREKMNFKYLMNVVPTKYPKCWRVMIAKFRHGVNIRASGCAQS